MSAGFDEEEWHISITLCALFSALVVLLLLVGTILSLLKALFLRLGSLLSLTVQSVFMFVVRSMDDVPAW